MYVYMNGCAIHILQLILHDNVINGQPAGERRVRYPTSARRRPYYGPWSRVRSVVGRLASRVENSTPIRVPSPWRCL